MNGRRQGKNPHSGSSKSHHISAVAHHFLAGPDGSRPEAGPDFVVTVLSWRLGPLASYAAAGLAAAAFRGPLGRERAAGSPAVFLEEAEDLNWSAASYLGGDHLRAEPPCAGSLRRRYWPLPGDPPATAGVPEPTLRLANLGRFDASCLHHLECLPGHVRRAGGALGEGGWLVWCLYRRDLNSRRAALDLGRLAALATPAGLELLAFPDGWDGRGAGFDRCPPAPRVGSAGTGGNRPWRFAPLMAPGVMVTATDIDGTVRGQGCDPGDPGAAGPFLPILSRIRRARDPIFRWTGHHDSP